MHASIMTHWVKKLCSHVLSGHLAACDILFHDPLRTGQLSIITKGSIDTGALERCVRADHRMNYIVNKKRKRFVVAYILM